MRSASLCAALLLVAACGAGGQEPLGGLELDGATMGTRYRVRLPAAAEGDRRRLSGVVAGELDAVDRAMSTWKPDSEISLLNRAPAGEPFPLSDPTWELLARALELARMTDGAFDVTVGPLVDAWGFGPEGAVTRVPTPQELDRLRAVTGPDRLTLDAATRTVTKAADGVRVDLSAIAKGYAVDRVARALEAAGHAIFMVEVGGELVTRGRPGVDRPWRIGLENPRGGVRRTLSLGDAAVASSGDYRNFYELERRIVGHTIDPRTGQPVDHRALAVSVLADNCARADALATALMVMGPEAGLAWAARHDVAALYLVAGDGEDEERLSPTFSDWLVELQ